MRCRHGSAFQPLKALGVRRRTEIRGDRGQYRIAWGQQARAEGDLTERARRRAAELARDGDLRLGAPRRGRSTPAAPSQATTAPRDERLPMAGTLLVRPYRGQMLQVKVLEQGFEYDGRIFDSLTAVTKRITGVRL